LVVDRSLLNLFLWLWRLGLPEADLEVVVGLEIEAAFEAAVGAVASGEEVVLAIAEVSEEGEEGSVVVVMTVTGVVVEGALAIREVASVMVMLMDMVLQVVGQADQVATVLPIKAMDRLVVGMVLGGEATGAISNEKDPVGMMTETPNDRDTSRRA